MKTLSEKEILFNRYYNGEMDKTELAKLVINLVADAELREWLTIQMEFMTILHDPRLTVTY